MAKKKIIARTEITAIQAVAEALVQFRYASGFYVNQTTKSYEIAWTPKGEKFASAFLDVARLAENIQLGGQFLDEAMSEVLSSVVCKG